MGRTAPILASTAGARFAARIFSAVVPSGPRNCGTSRAASLTRTKSIAPIQPRVIPGESALPLFRRPPIEVRDEIFVGPRFTGFCLLATGLPSTYSTSSPVPPAPFARRTSAT